MAETRACFFFDFVDPLSYLVELAVDRLEAERGMRVERVGCELRPPPAPLTRPSDALWEDRWEAARRTAPQVVFDPPPLVPWTRKAHELHAFARSRGAGPAVRRGIFEAFLLRGRDIGRVDELVAIAAAGGLDATEAKAALDVDAHAEEVLRSGRRAEEVGLAEVPALLVGDTLAQGFHNLGDLNTLLGGSPGGGR